MAEIRVNSTGGVKLFDADDSHYAQIKAGTISSNTDVLELGSSAVVAGTKVDLNGQELILDADADTSITADTDDQIDVRIAGADDFQFTANTFTAQSGSSIVVPDGGLTFGSTAISSTAAELNLLDGGTSVGSSITLADADGFVVNDGGTMKTIPASDVSTYAAGNLVKIAGTDVTSDTSGVELQSCFNTTYDSYMLVVRRFIPATNNQNLRMQIMTSTNTVVSATNYFYAFRYFEDTNSLGGLRDDDGTFFELASATNTEQDGGFSGTYLLTVDKTDNAGNSFKITGHGGVRNVNGDLTAWFGAGVYNDSTSDVSPTGLKFTVASGNVSKLQVTVYGIKE
jgi:hypothetical protein